MAMFRRREKQGTEMSDPTSTEPIHRRETEEFPRTGDGYAGSGRMLATAPERPISAPPAPDPVSDTSARGLKADATALRAPCPHCRGKGFVMTTSDLLRESVGLLGRTEDDAVLVFYRHLLEAAPSLAEIFPADLLAPRHGLGDPDSRGIGQRDKLYGALEALATMYDPADTSDDGPMARLNTALCSFGRAHASFVRPSEGVTRGATVEEYGAVKAVLFATFHELAGEKWLPEYDAAWAEAYDYAALEMLREQYRSAFRAPRFPRAAR
jgi:hemoglobin-like flavoprotein